MSRRSLKSYETNSRTVALMKMVRRRRPHAAIGFLCSKLVGKTKQDEPPFDVFQYAEMRNAQIVEEPNLPAHGILDKNGNGYIIKIDSELPLTRRRFTICHELVHTFFEDASWKFRLGAKKVETESEEEEKLCDFGAAELLMPATAFKNFVSDRRRNFELVRDIAEIFQVSTEAAAIRVVRIVEEPFAFIRWYVTAFADTLRPKISSTKSLRQFHPQKTPSEVLQCLSSQEQTVGSLGWFYGGVERRLMCESIPLGRYNEFAGSDDLPVVFSVLSFAD